MINIQGYIVHSEIEGGCTYLRGDDGNNYELMYDGILPPTGSYVIVMGKIRDDLVSICNIGKILQVSSIYKAG